MIKSLPSADTRINTASPSLDEFISNAECRADAGALGNNTHRIVPLSIF